MIRLDWGHSPREVWCPLDSDFSDVRGTGVYIVRQNTGRTVVVGQGVIKDCLSALQQDSKVLCYDSPTSPLLATWAIVQGFEQTRMLYSTQLDGMERYLAEILEPLLGKRFPDVIPIPVPLPGSRRAPTGPAC